MSPFFGEGPVHQVYQLLADQGAASDGSFFVDMTGVPYSASGGTGRPMRTKAATTLSVMRRGSTVGHLLTAAALMPIAAAAALVPPKAPNALTFSIARLRAAPRPIWLLNRI